MFAGSTVFREQPWRRAEVNGTPFTRACLLAPERLIFRRHSRAFVPPDPGSTSPVIVPNIPDRLPHPMATISLQARTRTSLRRWVRVSRTHLQVWKVSRLRIEDPINPIHEGQNAYHKVSTVLLRPDVPKCKAAALLNPVTILRKVRGQ
jgi:hypothetical protein